MLATFPKDFPQATTSQARVFSKQQLPKVGIFPSGDFQNVEFPKRQLPKSVPNSALGPELVLAAALCSLAHSLAAALGPPIAACGVSEGLTCNL